MRTIRWGTCLMLAALVGCGGGSVKPGTSPSTTAPVATRISSTGMLTVLEPQPGAVIKGTSLTVKVQVTGARILTAASTDVRPDTAHVHLAVDGITRTLLAGTSYTITDLTKGTHLLQAEFAAADHGPFNPRVIVTVTFTVE